MNLIDSNLLLTIAGSLLAPYIILLVVLAIQGRRVNLVKNYEYRPTLTVFLPTFNESEFIGKKLNNLLGQTYPIREILVYDCSTDDTPSIVEQYKSKFHNIKLIKQPFRIGMAKTLNQALNDAIGEIVIKTDCDSLARSNDSVRELIANFADQRVGGATGICIPQYGMERYFRKFMTIIQVAETNIDSTIIAHASSLLAFRKSAVEPVSENSMADDTEEFVLIRKKGFRTVVDPSVQSEEEVPTEYRKRRLQKDRRAQGIIKVLLRNISVLFNREYGRFGSIILPLELFILVLSPILLMIVAAIMTIALYTIHPILTIPIPALIVFSLAKKSSFAAAVLDTQLSGLVGTAKSLLTRDTPLWAKVR